MNMNKWTKPKILYQIYQSFLEECAKRQIQIDNQKLAHDFIYLLVRDPYDGIALNNITQCKLKYFLNEAIRKFEDPLNATTATFKLKYYYKDRKELNMEYVKQKYAEEFQIKLNELITAILRYPQTSNKEQIQQMSTHIQVFIIAAYNIGSPKDHVLIKKTKQSLESVIGKDDLKDYVMKVRFNRLEYLQRLSATVCGIVIYNSQDPKDEKGRVRDILPDLEMAQRNTKESLEVALQRAAKNIEEGSKTLEDNIAIDGDKKMMHLDVHIVKLHRVNNFIVFYTLYHRYIKQIQEGYMKVQYLISVAVKKMKCVFEKINDVLKYRTAIQSELIFPHFAYLSELWTTLVLYLNYLTEINKIKDLIDSIATDELEQKFNNAMNIVRLRYEPNDIQKDFTFHEIYENKKETKINVHRFKQYIKHHCTLTISLTDGLLVPAQIIRKQCQNVDIEFGYRDVIGAKYALRYFPEYFKPYKHAVVNSRNLILLYDLEDQILREVIWADILKKIRPKESGTQTEMCIENDLSVPNWVNVTWNIWDYHRETIHLANIRKLQTHSSQTNVCYGQRNAQNQTYYTRKHFGH